MERKNILRFLMVLLVLGGGSLCDENESSLNIKATEDSRIRINSVHLYKDKINQITKIRFSTLKATRFAYINRYTDQPDDLTMPGSFLTSLEGLQYSFCSNLKFLTDLILGVCWSVEGTSALVGFKRNELNG